MHLNDDFISFISLLMISFFQMTNQTEKEGKLYQLLQICSKICSISSESITGTNSKFKKFFGKVYIPCITFSSFMVFRVKISNKFFYEILLIISMIDFKLWPIVFLISFLDNSRRCSRHEFSIAYIF